MKKGEVSITEFPLNSENPFLKQAVEEVQSHIVKKWKNNSGTSRNAILTGVNADGEPVGHSTFVQLVKVDEDKFAKLFLAHFQVFFNLSNAGIRVLGYILQCMRPKKDMVAFSVRDCQEFTHYKSKAMVYKGLTELLSCGVIARGMEDWQYYINPLIVFNGDRVTFVNEYIKANDKAKRLEGTAKAERHKRIVSQAQALEWKINEEVFFNGDSGKEPARIIDIDTESGIMTLLLYKTNKSVMVAVNSDRVIRRELTFKQI